VTGSEWSAAAPPTGIVTVGVVGLRREPGHSAELLSQGLLGETFRVLEVTAAGDWLRVCLDADGYEGWLRAWGAVPAAGEALGRWAAESVARVAAREASVRAAPRRGSPVLLVAPWQSRLSTGEVAGAWVEVGLPDGRRGYAPRSALARGPAPGGAPTPARLLRTAERLLGTPYLWGGRSVWGYDCSGFVQSVFAWHGIRLPRDSKDQFVAAAKWKALGAAAAGRPAESPRGPRGGSLLFFGSTSGEVGHVALGAGDGEFLHAYGQVGRGSLNPESQHFVKTLVSQYIGAWRWPFPRVSARGRH
jgi:cell wall-associated NlpC family hydrolase